jgi:hypothetical protein
MELLFEIFFCGKFEKGRRKEKIRECSNELADQLEGDLRRFL